MEELTFDDYLSRVSIQDVLNEAGYRLNRKDGIRWPSYSRCDSDGHRISGDKFLVTTNGQCCFQPPADRRYNVISFITEHPQFFPQYHAGMNPYALVHKVCQDIMGIPEADRKARTVVPNAEHRPFDMSQYEISHFDISNKDSYKQFYPFFAPRAISLSTQAAFGSSFLIATRQTAEGKSLRNLAFPMHIPGQGSGIVGLEMRGRMNADGKSYKGMAPGSNSSQGLWMASPNQQSGLERTRNVFWFESAYDAMAYYQHNRNNFDARTGIYVSTGGSPSVTQIRGVLDNSHDATHHLCFDNDEAGQQFSALFRRAAGIGEYKPSAVQVNSILARPDLIPYLQSLKARESLADRIRDVFTLRGRREEFSHVMSGDMSLLPDDFRKMDRSELRDELIDYCDLYEGSRAYAASLADSRSSIYVQDKKVPVGDVSLLPAPLQDMMKSVEEHQTKARAAAYGDGTSALDEEMRENSLAASEFATLTSIIEAWTGSSKDEHPAVNVVREYPAEGCKDWNEQIMKEQDRSRAAQAAEVGETVGQSASVSQSQAVEQEHHMHR